MIARLSRRLFLGAAMAGSALAASHGRVFAREYRPFDLLLHEASSVDREHIIHRYSPRQVIALEDDVVRHWRGALGGKIVMNGGAMAVSRWSAALVLEGLAREAGGKAVITRIGPDAFETRIDIPGAQS